MNPKKIYRMWFVLALLICATLVATAAIPDTLAYIQQESNTVQNRITVTHTPPEDAFVPVQVHKTISSLGEKTISPEGFTFSLQNMTTGEIITLVSDAKGNAATMLSFTEEDVGFTYHYQLRELPGIDPSITYDDQVYDIRISLTVDLFHRIQADVTVSGIPTDSICGEFVNVFDPFLVPKTGDEAMPMLYAALLLMSGAALILLRKRPIHH